MSTPPSLFLINPEETHVSSPLSQARGDTRPQTYRHTDGLTAVEIQQDWAKSKTRPPWENLMTSQSLFTLALKFDTPDSPDI